MLKISYIPWEDLRWVCLEPGQKKYKKFKTQKIFEHRKPLQTFRELKHFLFYKLYNTSVPQEKESLFYVKITVYIFEHLNVLL